MMGPDVVLEYWNSASFFVKNIDTGMHARRQAKPG
jgi:hypothetical protein